jgi:hypothetical protein
MHHRALPLNVPLLINLGKYRVVAVFLNKTIKTFYRKHPSYQGKVYAHESPLERYITTHEFLRYNSGLMGDVSIFSSQDIITWEYWKPEFAALTINWKHQSAGYKKLAYGG